MQHCVIFGNRLCVIPVAPLCRMGLLVGGDDMESIRHFTAINICSFESHAINFGSRKALYASCPGQIE